MVRERRFEPLGELETVVMGVVWARSPVCARQVCERLHGSRARAYTTIMTTLDRLHRKGILLREKDGLAWSYRPVLDKEAFERAVADKLVGEILASHRGTALAAFVDAASEDGELLARLAELVERRRRGKP